MVEENLSMKVNLFVSARKLKDKDVIGKSDPRCILFEQRNGKWHKLDKTEQIKDNLNPDFRTPFHVSYYFEREQKMKFAFIDGDGDGDYEELGDVEVSMGQLMGARAQTWTGTISHKGSNGGQIIVRAESIVESNEWLKADISMRNVNNMGGGCMGMCAERIRYRVEIQKLVPGTGNYATVAKLMPPRSFEDG